MMFFVNFTLQKLMKNLLKTNLTDARGCIFFYKDKYATAKKAVQRLFPLVKKLKDQHIQRTKLSQQEFSEKIHARNRLDSRKWGTRPDKGPQVLWLKKSSRPLVKDCQKHAQLESHGVKSRLSILPFAHILFQDVKKSTLVPPKEHLSIHKICF